MKDLCLFYDLNDPNVGLLGLFDNAENDSKNIKSSSPDALYEVRAIYSTEIESLDEFVRLFAATFHSIPDSSMIDGVLCISASADQAINWLQDIAALTETKRCLRIFSSGEKTIKGTNSGSGNHIFAQNIDFEAERRQSVSNSISHAYSQTADTEQRFTLTLHDIRASALSNDAAYSKINTINKDTIKAFLNFKGYGLTDDNFVCSVSENYSNIEYLFSLPPSTFNVPWVLALNDRFRKKVFVFKIPDYIDLSGGVHDSSPSGNPVPALLAIPAGNLNFPCGKTKIELKSFLDKSYGYSEILQTHIPNNAPSYNLVSFSFFGTDCKVHSWFDVFCGVLDSLYTAKSETFVANLKKFLDDTELSFAVPDSEHVFRYHYIDRAKVWIKVPQSPEGIVNFLKKAFKAFTVPTKLLKIKFRGKNPFASSEGGTNSEAVKVQKSMGNPKIEEAIEISLDKAPDMLGKRPVYFIYEGRYHLVKSWKELLQGVFEALDSSHPWQLRVIASMRRINPIFRTYPSLKLSKQSDKYEQLPKSGVCFITEVGANNTIIFIKYVFKKLGIDPGSLTIAYYDCQSKTNLAVQSASSPHNKTASATKNSNPYFESTSVILKRLKQNGYIPHGVNTTIARSLNGYYGFLAKRAFFKSDWTLILDDIINKKYYVFEIPKKSINTNGLKWQRRNSEPYVYISIPHGDRTFTDKWSKIGFSSYYVFGMDYSSLMISNSRRH